MSHRRAKYVRKFLQYSRRINAANDKAAEAVDRLEKLTTAYQKVFQQYEEIKTHESK